MREEYEIILITEEGRAIKNNKTGKIYHSEFEIIEEKNKEIDRLNNILDELEKWVKEDVKEEKPDLYFQVLRKIDVLDKLKALKENNNE